VRGISIQLRRPAGLDLPLLLYGPSGSERHRRLPVRRRFIFRRNRFSRALSDVARQTKTNILFSPEAIPEVRTPALDGAMTAQAAVERLIAGTDLESFGIAADSSSAANRSTVSPRRYRNTGPF